MNFYNQGPVEIGYINVVLQVFNVVDFQIIWRATKGPKLFFTNVREQKYNKFS